MVTHWAPPVLIFQVYFPVWLEEEIYLSFLTLKCCFCKRNSIWNQVFCCICSLSLLFCTKGWYFHFKRGEFFTAGLDNDLLLGWPWKLSHIPFDFQLFQVLSLRDKSARLLAFQSHAFKGIESRRGDSVPYEEVSDLMYYWVAQRPDFKSALRVLNMLLNIQNVINIYSLQCDFTRKMKRNTQKIKIADFIM